MISIISLFFPFIGSNAKQEKQTNQEKDFVLDKICEELVSAIKTFSENSKIQFLEISTTDIKKNLERIIDFFDKTKIAFILYTKNQERKIIDYYCEFIACKNLKFDAYQDNHKEFESFNLNLKNQKFTIKGEEKTISEHFQGKLFIDFVNEIEFIKFNYNQKSFEIKPFDKTRSNIDLQEVDHCSCKRENLNQNNSSGV